KGIPKGFCRKAQGCEARATLGTPPMSLNPERLPQKNLLIVPLNLIEYYSSVVGCSVAANTVWRVPAPGTARLKDWFWSSAHVLFGDAAWAVFPLGRLVLQMTTGRRAAGKCNNIQLF